MTTNSARLVPVVLILCIFVPLASFAEIVEPVEDDAHPFGHLEWRNVGPVNMSGRVADVEGVPGRPQVVYVGAASGGVRTTTSRPAISSVRWEGRRCCRGPTPCG